MVRPIIQRRCLLERQPDSLTSLGLVAPTLAMFKQHCGLPDDPAWTEQDLRLGLLLDAAERYLDLNTGTTYRARNFTLTVQEIRDSEVVSIASEVTGRWYTIPVGRFTRIRLPCRPVTGTPTIVWTDNAGVTGSFVLGTDFVFTGGKSLTPEITFLATSPTSWPSTGLVPWPFVVTFSTAANTLTPEIHLLAILMLASHFFRNPQGMVDVPHDGIFGSLFTSLQGDFL